MQYCLPIGILRISTLVASIVFGAGAAATQTAQPAPNPGFDVVSIRRSTNSGMRLDYTPDGFIATNMPLEAVIVNAYAYRLGDPQFMTGAKIIPGGPGWIASERYDIRAKVSDVDALELKNLSNEQQIVQIRIMLQGMLADRFHLKVHSAAEQTPGFALIVAEKGPRLKQSTATNHHFLGTRGHITAIDGSMADLVFVLVGALHTPVIDRTGLTGRYDFTLTYTADELQQPGADISASAAVAAPSIFTAVREQLGLKLEHTKVPTQGLVIDQIARPSEN